MLSDKAASDLEKGEGEWLNMQPVIRKAFKDNYDWLASHQEAMEKLNHAFIKLSSKLESRVETEQVKSIMDKQISGALKKAAREDKTGDEIAKLSYELAKFNSLRVEIEKKVSKEELTEQLRLKVDKTDTSIKQLFGNIVTNNLTVMKEDLQAMRSKELEANEVKLADLTKNLKDNCEKMDKRLSEVEELKGILEETKNKFELYPSYSAIHSMLDRKADKSTLETHLPQKVDQQIFVDSMRVIERTLAEHERSITTLKLRAELGSDGQSRNFRTNSGIGPLGEISPVNASVKGEQERFMMGFTSGGDDSIMQVLPLSFRNDTPSAKVDNKTSINSADEMAKKLSAQVEARKTASDSGFRAFNTAMNDMLGGKAAAGMAGVEEPARLLEKLNTGRVEAILTTMWHRMNQMHDETIRLREENHYLHNKLIQIDNTQYAQHFDNIHKGNENDQKNDEVALNQKSEATLDIYATSTDLAELREAISSESRRVDTLMLHNALVKRTDEELQNLKRKLSNFDLSMASLTSSRDSLDGKTQDIYLKLDHVSKRIHSHHENYNKRIDSCSNAISKLSTDTLGALTENLQKLEKKINEIDFESMRAHTLEGNQQDRLRAKLNNLEKLTYSLETKLQANLNQNITETSFQEISVPPAPAATEHSHLHPGSFQERYHRRSTNASATPSRIPSPVKHRSSNSALDLRLARLQREKEELQRTLGLTFTGGAAE